MRDGHFNQNDESGTYGVISAMVKINIVKYSNMNSPIDPSEYIMKDFFSINTA